ncbi:sigma-70 family RNA polymerase sigma factor [bacterium]|nr:MAG: sigma-70 family RNA polymerase sigma factor [bacterium]
MEKLAKEIKKLSPENFTANTFIPDEGLIRGALKGSKLSLEMLVKRHMNLVYNISRRYVQNSDDAEDITQETFVKVWKNLKSFQLDRNFPAWISKTARNTALDWLKKRRAIPFSSFENEYGENPLYETLADHSPTPYEFASRTGLVETLRQAIARLTPKYRDVVTLHDQKEMTFQEIADSTRKPLNTVKSQYRRAVAKLRKIMNRR